MLLLAYLVTRNKAWHAAKIRVLATSVDHPTEETMNEFRSRLADARIEAEPEIVFNANMSNIIAYSKNASLVFLPLRRQACHFSEVDRVFMADKLSVAGHCFYPAGCLRLERCVAIGAIEVTFGKAHEYLPGANQDTLTLQR